MIFNFWEERLTKRLNLPPCLCLDLPILLSAAGFLLLAVIDLVFLVRGSNSHLGMAAVLLLSLLANLVLVRLIQLTFSILKLRFARWQLWVMGLTWGAVCVYFIAVVTSRDYIYVSDSAMYVSRQYLLESSFGEGGVVLGMIDWLKSFVYDYTSFINIFHELTFFWTSRTGDAFILIQLLHIALPLTVLLGAFVGKVGEVYGVSHKQSFFVLSFLTLALLPQLLASALVGQPDWFGLIFCFMILLLTMDLDFRQPDIVRYVLIWICTACLILTRRWYIYFLLGYYACWGTGRLLSLLCLWRTDREDAGRQCGGQLLPGDQDSKSGDTPVPDALSLLRCSAVIGNGAAAVLRQGDPAAGADRGRLSGHGADRAALLSGCDHGHVFFPDTSLGSKLSYGAGILGTHAFPTELFDARYVITCEPFYETTNEYFFDPVLNAVFLELRDEKFTPVKTVDMGNGIVFTAYQRTAPVDLKEIDLYRAALTVQDAKFPDCFSEVWDAYIREHGLT